MEVIELRTATHHRTIEWPTTLEVFLEGARAYGHEVAKLQGLEFWLVFNPVTMAWCEAGPPTAEVVGTPDTTGPRAHRSVAPSAAPPAGDPADRSGETIELRTATHRRTIEWPTTLEVFLEGARAYGHEVAKLQGLERWLVFNPVTMDWCEVGRPTF